MNATMLQLLLTLLLSLLLWSPTSASNHDNPFSAPGLVGYVNPDYTGQVERSIRRVPSSDRDLIRRMQKAGRQPTAVWLDRISAIRGGQANGGRMSLLQHLQEGVRQASAAGSKSSRIVMVLVVYDLPGRDCAASASAGEIAVGDQARYRTQFVDAIRAALLAKPEFLRRLEVVLVVEPDSLPNAVTNLALGRCSAAVPGYEAGISYVLDRLATLPHVSAYLDAGNSGWLGWPGNLAKAADLYGRIMRSARAKGAKVRGLATNVANVVPLQEPFLRPGSSPAALKGDFFQYNPAFDELAYVRALALAMAERGVTNVGFVIDTGRNGWAPVNDGKPIDRRKARGNWCNVVGAGIGEKPRFRTLRATAGGGGVDAYLWIKPAGEADGGSSPQARGYDPNCDPRDPKLDAMAGSPAAGEWFHEAFVALVRNAHPPL
jgi:cellulose 1,4-beta-cellobiosidase